VNVLSRFKEYFEDEPIEEVEPDTTQDDRLLEERRNDAKLFVGTQAYKDFRDMVNASIYACTPDPLKGTDVAGAMALKQAGLRESMEALDRVARRCEE